ncbi:hypothetical protein [Chryseobacterium viscerum]|uniref:Uncharacterized protein n=1 Tax=Chryseobacterium viscerum TaxID=1037377 RepID=A0A316WV48_9FLAO|nr:hypothetical protein [Chryseobacterium viscerum]PWN64183.1 hypothetical protein C1634_006200 [Chryseobacterium viscerum]
MENIEDGKPSREVKNEIFTTVTNMVALTCLYIETKFHFLEILGFSFWFIPLLLNIGLLLSYLSKNKNKKN